MAACLARCAVMAACLARCGDCAVVAAVVLQRSGGDEGGILRMRLRT